MKELLGHGVLPIPPQGINGGEGVEPATSVHKRKEKKKHAKLGAHRACALLVPLTIRKPSVLHGELCEVSPALLVLLYLNTSSSRAKSRPSHVQVGPSRPP